MWFSDWDSIRHVFVVGSLSYVGLVVLLRVSGKRTLSKWNSFDFAVTVAFGSMLATALLSLDTKLAQALCALALLIALQYVATFLSVRFEWFESLIKGEATLLYMDGQFRDDSLRKQRVTRIEVLSAMRQKGHACMDEVWAVVLETDGEFSVLSCADGAEHPRRPTLADVEGWEPDAGQQVPEV